MSSGPKSRDRFVPERGGPARDVMPVSIASVEWADPLNPLADPPAIAGRQVVPDGHAPSQVRAQSSRCSAPRTTTAASRIIESDNVE